MKKVGLLLVLVAFVFLTGCCLNCCPTCPPIQTCTLTVEAGYWVWGTIYINDQSTGQYIDFESNPSTTIANVPCNQTIKIYLIDNCGAMSRIEYMYIAPGTNYLYFDNWYGKGSKGLEDRSSRECHDCITSN